MNGAGLLAHIAGVPVEEWLPFLVPIVGLYLWGRRRERRRRTAVAGLPAAGEALAEGVVAQVLDRWRDAGYGDLAREHLPLLYPPGPDGLSAGELARRAGPGADMAAVEGLLDELEEGEYVELDEPETTEGRRAWLTLKGYALVDSTEDALLRALADDAAARRGR
jgi:hypothetical protein